MYLREVDAQQPCELDGLAAHGHAVLVDLVVAREAIARVENEEEGEENLDVSDRKNLEDGFISISPIKVDMHSNSQQQVVADWAKNL